MIQDHIGYLVDQRIRKTPTQILDRPRDRDNKKRIDEQSRERSPLSSPAAPIKGIHKIEDDESVQYLPGMRFEQDRRQSGSSSGRRKLVLDIERTAISQKGCGIEIRRYINGTRILQRQRL